MKHWSLTFCLVIAALFGSVGYASQSQAQDNVWLQIDAQKSKTTAERSARHYDDFLPDVAGFSITSGWYVIAVGPYSKIEAQTLLQTYRNARQIPNDSFINYAEDYVHRFWPYSTKTAPQIPSKPTQKNPIKSQRFRLL